MKTVNFRDGKKTFQAVPKRGETMGRCATFNRKYLCCHVHVLRSVQNCPFECSYCFLQNYLNDGITRVVVDTGALMDEVRKKTGSQQQRFFRIGTWELGDSLALERDTGQAGRLVQEFAVIKNAVLELKTKSNCTDPLVSINHSGRTVISWSLNTEKIIKEEEHGTSSLEERLEAMYKAANAGYLVGVHFDPMIFYKGWEKDYGELAGKVFETVLPERVAWISIGSLRFNPEMKKKIENNYPDSMLTAAEMVAGDDFKMRYVKPLRVEMYRHLYRLLRERLARDNLVYLCMERWDVWERVFGFCPDSVGHLDYLFARSLYERYGLGEGAPERAFYENNDQPRE